ncbi:nucleoside deaminase [Adhaeretor mobilis]|uniref:Guanine deaminase n=1 Tax=Adhaeretor mobilis TaxID=1930276 RepID=A0A517MUQ3_9BACT|nr:nucleoside deaminase [Adhaeretor mobilis]QDS98598.1 Guanine deaminase [Adhaeretor mobilis]
MPESTTNGVITPEDLMREAIKVCREGLAAGQSPFGCAIAIDSNIISRSHNTVMASTDVTAHAEVNAIRAANQELRNVFLEGAIVATTCEPCPMCMSALHWARVDTVYYGATIADAEGAGFNELQLPASEVLRIGQSTLKLKGDMLREECSDLFQQWLAMPERKVY